MFSGSMSITWHVFGSMFWVDPDWLRNASQPFLGPKKWRWMSGPSRLKPAVSPDRCHRTWVHFLKMEMVLGDGHVGIIHTHTHICDVDGSIVLNSAFVPAWQQGNYFTNNRERCLSRRCFHPNVQKFVDDWIGHRVRNKQLVASVLGWYWYRDTIIPWVLLKIRGPSWSWKPKLPVVEVATA